MESDLSGTKRVCEEIGVDSDSATKKTRVSDNMDDDQEKKEEPAMKTEIDLNVSVPQEDKGVDKWGKSNRLVRGFDLNDQPMEVICISSDDDNEDEMLGKPKDDKMKGKGNECPVDLNLRLGFNEAGEGSSIGGKRRYTREEKGKAKIEDELSLSLGSTLQLGHLNVDMELGKAEEVADNMPLFLEQAELFMSITSMIEEQKRLMIESQQRDIAFRLERVREYAYFDHEEEFWYRLDRQKKVVKDEIKLEEFAGLFSAALKAILDRNAKREPKELIEWNARHCDVWRKNVPSLLELSLDVLAKNAGAISSLDHVPEGLKQRLTNLLCDKRKMNVNILELLCKGSPTEIRIKDCSWMTGKQLVDTIGKANKQNLRVLQLDLCGQCSFDEFVYDSIAQSANSMPCLAILSLKGSGHLAYNTLKALLRSAPLLQSINLSQSTLLTSAAIEIIADFLKSNLKELYIDHCSRIDAMCALPSMIVFERLEVLSVAGIHTVCDDFVGVFVAARGGNLKELNLAFCGRLTNRCLEAIGNCCPRLIVLDVSNLRSLTDLGISYLANGCRSLESLNVTGGEFSDEAVAAFLETSGASLKVLSLNSVRKVSFNTAYSLVKCSRNLISLDLSWCRRITDEALGFIVDNCESLKQLKIFGCTQITGSFLLSHSILKVQILGGNMAPLLERVNMLEPVGVMLHHSSLET